MLSVLMDDVKEHSHCLARRRPPQNYKTVVIDKMGSSVLCGVCVCSDWDFRQGCPDNDISYTFIC